MYPLSGANTDLLRRVMLSGCDALSLHHNKERLMSVTAMPRTDATLLGWADKLSQKIALAAYGVPTTLQTAFNTSLGTFRTALAECQPGERTIGRVKTKNQARTLMKVQARFVISAVNSNPAVTDQMKDEAGINVRKKPAPRPAVTTSPTIEVKARNNTSVTLTIKAQASDKRRGKPANAEGVAVFSFVGATPPTDVNAWVNHGYSGQTKWELDFPGLAPGTTVWFTAFWFNARGAGPGSNPISTAIAGGSLAKGTLQTSMRIAA
jgi:hypothetical protein